MLTQYPPASWARKGSLGKTVRASPTVLHAFQPTAFDHLDAVGAALADAAFAVLHCGRRYGPYAGPRTVSWEPEHGRKAGADRRHHRCRHRVGDRRTRTEPSQGRVLVDVPEGEAALAIERRRWVPCRQLLRIVRVHGSRVPPARETGPGPRLGRDVGPASSCAFDVVSLTFNREAVAVRSFGPWRGLAVKWSVRGGRRWQRPCRVSEDQTSGDQ